MAIYGRRYGRSIQPEQASRRAGGRPAGGAAGRRDGRLRQQSKEAHCLSPLAAVVFAHCDGRTTIEELAALATERLGEPVDEPRVIDALAQLQERDLLAVPPGRRALPAPDDRQERGGGGRTRRRFADHLRDGAGRIGSGILGPAGRLLRVRLREGNVPKQALRAGAGPKGRPLLPGPQGVQQVQMRPDDNDCNADQCGDPAGACPPVITMASTVPACGQTAVWACCYPDPDAGGTCCRSSFDQRRQHPRFVTAEDPD